MPESHTVVPPEVEELAREAAVSPTSHDWIYVCGAGLLVGLVAVAWIFYRRTHPRRHHHHRHSQEPARGIPPGTTGPPQRAQGQSPHRHSRRRRWGRRNPTLAQTGGLPPVREESPPTSAQPS